MKLYLINSLKSEKFDAIITLLDYKTQISKCLKSIKINPKEINKILIDTLLCSGMNEYRFIEANLNDDGTINLINFKYVTVSNNILRIANRIVKCEPLFLKSSVLPKSQIKKIARS
ncbi:hypothetical protein DA803_00130 [[Mycoplasma] phocae]|uniref:Uncharacterized protein n=1 Tax=[Mycoplasma] phocae TaxID=142651 RepID=A0A2Z5IPD1_9BACT|nr:type II toxin-antitoxin system RnlB family antitoxin [[Mycoplasma] phocae]AXE60509.1 hypothetical protein DA803_00130 [[Mycoplasma] phocae]